MIISQIDVISSDLRRKHGRMADRPAVVTTVDERKCDMLALWYCGMSGEVELCVYYRKEEFIIGLIKKT